FNEVYCKHDVPQCAESAVPIIGVTIVPGSSGYARVVGWRAGGYLLPPFGRGYARKALHLRDLAELGHAELADQPRAVHPRRHLLPADDADPVLQTAGIEPVGRARILARVHIS